MFTHKFVLVFLFGITFIQRTCSQKVPHCAYGITVKELLRLAGISGSNLETYEAKFQKHNIDETVLGNLNLQQLQGIGVTALGDRLKIQKFFAGDGNDCDSTTCKNGGICQDGFRCFSCRCDGERGYYGQHCELKCPCRNGGRCKTTRTGFKCECVPGFSGDLCEKMYLKEDRILQIEKNLAELNSLRILIKNLTERRGSWKLHRTNEILNQLEKLQIAGSTPTFNQKIPVILPKETRAILISVLCNFQNSNGHAYVDYEVHQKDNKQADAIVYGYNRHYNAYYNTYYYEQTIPWDGSLPNEIAFKVTRSSHSGGSSNWYRVRLVGYITD